MSKVAPSNTSVLIVGGGLVGLSAGLFLQAHKVPLVLIEKNARPSILPRSRGVHVRTMELFRQVGVEDAVRDAAAAAWEQGVFGGARRGSTMLDSQALNIPASIEEMTRPDPSPCAFCACPQTLLEPALRQPLEECGGDLRAGCELVSFTEGSDGVEALVRDMSGREERLSADYLLAADGGRSLLRHQLGFGSTVTPAQTHYLNVFFRADLTESVRGRTFSQCEVANERVRGLFLSKNNTTEWSFHLEYDPAVDDPTTLLTETLGDLVRAAIGRADLPVEILARTTWSTAVRVTEHYRGGRVFLAGDAAHVMPPWGGFNGNTGIADAHNLAWKLAATLAGRAGPDLLDTYERERRPLAVHNGRQALLRSDFDARFGVATPENRDALAQQLDTGALLMRHRYPTGEPVESLRAQTGTRFPHAWIRRGGERLSTLDLFGTQHVLVCGALFRGRAGDSFQQRQVVGVDFEFEEAGSSWAAFTDLPEDGALLVRPDGFVADRFDQTQR